MNKVQISGELKDISSASVRVGEQTKAFSRTAYFNGTEVKTLKTFTTAMTATVSPFGVSKTISGGGTATTDAVTVTPSGGTGPYTYAWVKTLGDGTIFSPTRASTRFSQALAAEDEATGSFRCTVTDSLGATATANTTASFFSISNN